MRAPLRSLVDSLRQGARACAIRPQRTLLGVLAMAVAVAAMVLVDTAIAGLSAFAETTAARAFGSETFLLAQIASPGTLPRRELENKLKRNPAIRRADLRFLERYAGERAIYAAIAQRAGVLTAGARKFENAAISGTSATLPEIRDLAIVAGRFFLPDEERRGAQVAVIGHEIAEQLFPASDPLGKTVRIGERGFTVIGVQEKLGTSGGLALDRYAWIPLPIYERIFGAAESLQISIRAPAGRAVEVAEERASATLRARRQLAPGEEDNFDLLTPEAARGFVMRLAKGIGAAAPLLSAMALLAAMVVVANTTLVSVTQRTFEIGVRRALGATRGTIVREVLSEATIVALAGGVLGTLLVLGAARALAGPLGIPLGVASKSIVVALTHAAGAGLLAGWYPAHRAGRANIVEALRAE